ncbi:MAG: hypothetical protein Q9162_000253 [Coniocarpon cinnabarinum]
MVAKFVSFVSNLRGTFKALRDGSTAVYVMHNALKACTGKDPPSHATAVFSLCMSPEIAELRIHWRNVCNDGVVEWPAALVGGFDFGEVVMSREKEVFRLRDVLTGAYEYPHLIIHADSANPTSASGTSYNGIASPSVSSLFNFDIPSSDAGKTCSLVFLLPNKDELTTSSYNMTGSGQIDFGMLAAVANQGTSFSNMPAMKQDFGVKTVSPGNSYVVASFACPQGQAVGFEMKSVGETALEWFEDYNAPGLGLYITTC